MTDELPRLSAVLPAILGYQIAERTVQHLVAQSIAHQIELVLVATEGDDGMPEAIPGLHSLQVVTVPEAIPLGKVYAAGVCQASAEVVVLCEDHSFPQQGWAEILLAEHNPSVAVVGPRVRFGNASRMIAWPDYLLGYGEWLDVRTRQERPFLPGHNSSYRRDVLMISDLSEMLESETAFHYRLAAEGHTLIIQPAAETRHYNYSKLGVWLSIVFHVGRAFAARRHSQRSKDLVYFLASPLIPVVRLGKILSQVKGVTQWRTTIMSAPVLILGLLVDSLGQAVGHLVGPGNAASKTVSAELNRFAQLSQVDKRSFLSENGQDG